MKKIFLLTLSALLCVSVQAQNLVAAFKPPVPLRPASIEQIKIQPDGNILVAGNIDFYQNKRVHNLIRIHPDGSLDETFTFEYNGNFMITNIELLGSGEIVILMHAYSAYDNVWSSDDSKVVEIKSDGTIEHELSVSYATTDISVQSDGKILLAMGSILKRYNVDFSLDDSFDNAVTFNGAINAVEAVGSKIFVAGSFSKVNDVTKNDVVKLNLDGSIDDTFDTGTGTSDYIGALTIQPDNKILLGRAYINSFNGVPGHGSMRLNADGSVDTNFNPPYFTGMVSRFICSGNAIYGSGYFSGAIDPLYKTFKLNMDGSMDGSFNPVITDNLYGSSTMDVSDTEIFVSGKTVAGNVFGLSKFDPTTGDVKSAFAPEISRIGVFSFAKLFNGKPLIGGDFIRVNGVTTFGLVRLNYDGSVDDSFTLNEDKGVIRQIEVLTDNTVLASSYLKFFKVDANGNILPTFNWIRGVNNLYQIIKFKILPNNKIVTADPNTLARLNADGSVDESFDLKPHDGYTATAFDFDIQGENYLYGSMFSGFGGIPVNKLARILPTGDIDQTFNMGTGIDNLTGFEDVGLIKVLDNSEILVGGDFRSFDGTATARGLVKLSKDGAMDLSFNKNQLSSGWPTGSVFFYATVIQTGSIVYISGDRYIYAIHTDGSDVNFKFPGAIQIISGIVSSSSTVEGASTGGRIQDNQEYLYAIGSFTIASSSTPTAIVKISVDKPQDNSTTPPGGTTTNPPPVVAGTEKSLDNVIRVFPQPATNSLNIDLKENTVNLDVRVYDLSGKLCASGDITGGQKMATLDLSNVAPGFYILKLSSESGITVVKKFLKTE